MDGATTPDAGKGWGWRVAAVLAYAGGLPVLALVPRWRGVPFAAHHYRHAAIVFLLFAVAVVLSAVVLLTLSYLLVFHREVYEGRQLEVHVLAFLRRMFLCWAVVWGFAALLAVVGSTRRVLLVSWLAAREGLVRAGGRLAVVACVVVIVASPFAVHASSLVRSDDQPGKVYFVYEDLDTFPRWIFALGFYRVALAAPDLYGPGETLLLPLGSESVARAKREGVFVVIGAHGRPQGMLYRNGWIRPAEVRAMPGGAGLRYVYLSSCDSGSQREAWEAAFAPAEVVTFDRLSAVAEHIWWLWVRAPGVLRATAAPDGGGR